MSTDAFSLESEVTDNIIATDLATTDFSTDFSTEFTTDLELTTAEQDLDKSYSTKIHIRIRKRTARKAVTTVEGFVAPDGGDLKDVVKYFRKSLACNGAVVKDKDDAECLQFQGDHRSEIKDVLIKKYNVKDGDIVVHGY